MKSIFIFALLFLGCQSRNVKKHLEPHEVLQTGWYFVSDTPTTCKRHLDENDKYYSLIPAPIITSNNFNSSNIFHDKDCFAIITWLNREGSELLDRAKQKSKGKKIAFVLNNELLRIQSIDDPQFAHVEEGTDPRTYGQVWTFPCNSLTGAESDQIRSLLEIAK